MLSIVIILKMITANENIGSKKPLKRLTFVSFMVRLWYGKQQIRNKFFPLGAVGRTRKRVAKRTNKRRKTDHRNRFKDNPIWLAARNAFSKECW